ncbi:unnamed protein product, partial [Mesorhabditis spiculigera]
MSTPNGRNGQTLFTFLALLLAILLIYDIYRQLDLNGGGKGSTCLPPFVSRNPTFLTSKAHNISVCKIEKTMSTFLTGIICYLDRKEKFIKANRNIHSEGWSQRFCGKTIEFHKNPLDNNTLKANMWKNWHLLAVVRDPISRFISGYINKCLVEVDQPKRKKNCYSCNKNLTCFVEHLYKNAQMFIRADGKKYLTYEAKHFFPQSWYCAFNNYSYTVIHYGDDASTRHKMSTEILQFLKDAKVEQSSLKYIEDELNFKSPHSNKNNSYKDLILTEIKSTPFLMKCLVQMFYYDYILFGVPLPFQNQ